MTHRSFAFLIGVATLSASCASARDVAPETQPAPQAKAQAAGPSSPVKKNHAPSSNTAPAKVKSKPKDDYDRASDLERRRKLALEELGAGTDTELVEDVFLIAAPGGRGALASAIDVTRRAIAAYFNNRFSKRPERVITIYLFPNAARYDKYCVKRYGQKCDSPYGFYLATDRQIIMNVGPGIGTLTHELVHPLVEADFPDAPDWINEGIASLFEQFYLPKPGEIRGGKNWRYPRLMAGIASKKERNEASLPALFGMSDEVFRGDREDLHYATARYLCQWLDQRDLLWPFYQRWRDGFDQDPTGEKAFTAVVGKTPAEADVEWKQWVRRL